MESMRQLFCHLALDLGSVSVLTFLVFYPRQRRRDLIPAYLALNVSLFALASALARTGGNGGIALAFGLIGVLSIVRLQSESLQSEEVAYYFTALVLGLIAGLPHVPLVLAATLCSLPLVVVYVAGHPRLFARTQRAVVTLDVAVTDPETVDSYIRERLGEPLSWKIQEVDFVRDLAVVDVRYRWAGVVKRHRGPVLSRVASAPRPRAGL